jgi:hypothetical protein
MFGTLVYDPISTENTPGKAYLVVKAAQLFSMERTRSRIRRLYARFLGRNMHLLDLSEILSQKSGENKAYIGNKTVPIDRIRGSESRCDDFDINLRPLHDHLRSRWINVAVARMSGAALPAVELIHVGGFYFIRDGHHRVSIARALGEKYIDAIVLARC